MSDTKVSIKATGLPQQYTTMQEVDDVGGDAAENGMKHHPHVYLNKENHKYSLAIASEHGALAFYTFNGLTGDENAATVNYAKTVGAHDPGCMVHAIDDQAPIPKEVTVEVTDGSIKSQQVVKTEHADEVSMPPSEVPPLDFVPMCHVEDLGTQMVIHCLVYVEGTKYVVDHDAVTQLKPVKSSDPKDGSTEWHLMLQMKELTDGQAPVLDRVSIRVDNSGGGIKSGDVIRLMIARGSSTGRSFAFPWP
jgi:hypothetical protein